MTTIHINALQQGDIVITYTGDQDKSRPMLDGSAQQAIHAEIVTSVDADNHRAAIVHQTNVANTKGTWQNDLIPSQSGAAVRQDTGALIRVLRCKNQNLAREAARLARQWSLYQTPYGEDRQSTAFEHQKTFANDPEGLVQAHRQLFQKVGKYRAIKYAARRDGWLCYPDESNEQDGMCRQKGGIYCTTFVVLCYQVAGLSPLVHTAHPADMSLRVSDKKMSAADLAKFSKTTTIQPHDLAAYKDYTANLRAIDPYELGDHPDVRKYADYRRNYRPKKLRKKQYLPSIAFWNTQAQGSIATCDFGQYITAGMMVDSKVIHTQGLYESLVRDDAGWQDLGVLTGKLPNWKDHYSESKEAREAREAGVKQQVAAARQKFIKG